jgi:hypothetical protein
MLAGGSAASFVLLSTGARAQTAPLIRKFGAARWVYRNENEFVSHPYVRGFWETAKGDLICNFSVATVNYAEAVRGNPELLSHTSLITSPGGRRGMTVRSEDRGRTWKVVSNDSRRPSNDVMAPRAGIDGRPGGLDEIGPVDFTNRDILVSNFSYLYMQQDPLVKDFYNDLKTIVDAPERQAFFRVSKDAGRSWSRSAMLPLDNLASLSAVESSVVRPDGRCLLFLNGTTPQAQAEARPLRDSTWPVRLLQHGGRHRLSLSILRCAGPRRWPGFYLSARPHAAEREAVVRPAPGSRLVRSPMDGNLFE